MDKPLSKNRRSGRKKKQILILVLAAMIVMVAIMSLRVVLKPTIRASEIITALVTKGNIENTLPASGEMIPEFEQVITSPVNASVKEVLLEPGTHAKAGDAVLILDKSASEAEYEKMKIELQSKRNNLAKLNLELDKSFFDIRSNRNIKELKINSLKAVLEDAKRLYKAGGGTREDIARAELDLQVAQLEKEQIENEIRNKQKTMEVEKKEALLLAAIQEQDLKELSRKLELANITVPRPGVITWVNKNIGASIREGETLVRIANLDSYKIAGNISDAYLSRIRPGIPVLILVNNKKFRGTIASVNPSIQNNLVSFEVQLAEKSNPEYRPNMKVEIHLITDIAENALVVENGPGFRGVASQDIFIVENGKAIRRNVRIGLTNFDQVQILDNVKEGETVIISDMSEFKHASSIAIRQ